MPSANMLVGSFHQVKDILGSIPSRQLLRFPIRLTSRRVGVLDSRRCCSQPVARTGERRYQTQETSKPCKIINLFGEALGSATDSNINKSKIPEIKPLQSFDLDCNVSIERVINRPAVIIVFDIETTGFSRQTERIIEFAARDLLGGKASTLETLVNPEKVVRNAHIHRIFSHMVNRPGVPRFKELIPILLQFVKTRQMNGEPVLWVAHNGRGFDVPFMINEFHRCDVEVPSDWLFLDTLPLARQLVKPDGTKLASSSLRALREHYRIPLFGPAHRAMQDVTTLCYVLQRLTHDLQLTVPDLMEKTFCASDITKPSR